MFRKAELKVESPIVGETWAAIKKYPANLRGEDCLKAV